MASPSSPPPTHSSGVRVRVSPLLLLLLLATAISTTTTPSAAARVSYADHCGSVVPESTPSGLFLESYRVFQLSEGYFSGGAGILDGPDPASPEPRSFYFRAGNLQRTSKPGVLKLYGTLTLRSPARGRNLTELVHRLHRVRPRLPKALYRRGRVRFELSGFWAESTGKLCMVGTGQGRTEDGNSLDLSAVFILNYPNNSTITSSIVSGSIKSVDAADSPNHFEAISILAYAQKEYEYTKTADAQKSCSQFHLKEESLAIENNSSCSYMQMLWMGRFSLAYGSNCSKGNCSPFGRDLGFLPSFMSFNQIQCLGDGRIHLFIGFSNDSGFSYHMPLVPERSIVAEGVWDQEGKRVCLVGCHIVHANDSLEQATVGDCSIGLSLWFPTVISIERRGAVVGQLWSNKKESDASYFPTVSFQSLDNNIIDTIPGLKYKYTKVDVASKSCGVENVQNVGKKYPGGTSVEDMRFDMTLKDTEGLMSWGYATPLSIGDTLYSNGFPSFVQTPSSAASLVETNHSLQNVSYRLSLNYAFHNSSLWASGLTNSSLFARELTEISAEGVYNATQGILCMVGCWHPGFTSLSKQRKTADSPDCEILIRIQFSPLNPEAGEHLTGTIESKREKSDPLYFAPVEVSSYGVYTSQALESIWRMDIEITMVLISLTLSCIFIGFQLFYVSKHMDLLPSVSLTMLVILTLGHMIPLVLNFEALFFMNRNRQNVLSWSGGWLEVNEVIVRIMTMVAFLLQFRFLQVAWSARSGEERKNGLWVAEKKSLKLCLPLYFVGGVIAWFVHLRSFETLQQGPDFSAFHHSLWEDLISYAGLILDGFLLPQIILNVFSNSKDKALTPIFYVGTTVIRAMPHLYDAYRARHYVPPVNSSYIYASPDGDIFSSAWDIIVPLEGTLFAVLIYLQQRFGGSCILPPRFRKHGGYEIVPEVSL